METRQCEWCGSSFEVACTTSTKKYCSHNCKSSAASKAMRERQFAERPTECAECGNKIVQPEKGRPRRFCSDICKRRSNNRKVRRQQAPLRDSAPEPRSCVHCGEMFSPRNRNRVYCYNGWCRESAYRERKASGAARRVVAHDVNCGECGATFTAKHPSARWCSKDCANRHWGRVRARQRRKASTADYEDREIFERDGWRCHLCGKKVSRSTSRVHPEGATIDHIVPLSCGGDDVASNVATAHWRCNAIKGVKASYAA
jgi:hypothetical protein